MSGPVVADGVLAALRFQRAGFGVESLSSPLYAALVDVVLADVEAGGPCAAVLAALPDGLDPIPDAVVLRYLGAVHRLVLRGGAPDLARWFPTAGGGFDPATDAVAAGADFVATNADHHDELVAGLALGVQTNEVGRCATLAVGFTELLRRFERPLRLLELGASAGLNLRWDRWRYESGNGSAWGRSDAPLRFAANYRDPAPDVSAPLGPDAAVVERLGCDRSPIDPTTDEGRSLLRSFVWPDQADRHARLDAALAAAAEVPASIEAADAASWLDRQLAARVSGTTTVVFHSIVWQYLPAATRTGVLAALDAAGAAATPEAPLAWLRMEPGPDPARAAEVRLRTWSGGPGQPGEPADELLAFSGYHGHPVWRA